MPIPRNWIEELTTEWLTIEGYMTESNVRLKAKRVGGVAEADVIGAKLDKDHLNIVHIETGSLTDGIETNLNKVKEKFDDDNRETVTSIVQDKLSWDSDVRYRAIYIAAYVAQAGKLKDMLGQNRVELWMLKEFIGGEVFKAIDNWKKTQIRSGRRKTQDIRQITLPECYWFLQLLDYLRQAGIMRLENLPEAE